MTAVICIVVKQMCCAVIQWSFNRTELSIDRRALSFGVSLERCPDPDHFALHPTYLKLSFTPEDFQQN
jgi:hypothetical protein